MSTVYSGSTATSARKTSASACGMSNCATSAPHERRNAAPKIPVPASSASTCGASSAPLRRSAIHCALSASAMPSVTAARPVCAGAAPLTSTSRGLPRPSPLSAIPLLVVDGDDRAQLDRLCPLDDDLALHPPSAGRTIFATVDEESNLGKLCTGTFRARSASRRERKARSPTAYL